MKYNFKKNISLSIISSILLLSGCSSTHEIISSSGVHAYNENFGLIQNSEVDARIHEEIVSQNRPAEVEHYASNNPNWTTDLVLEPNTFTAENYVQAPTIITYKYKFDPKFYNEAVWKSAE